MNGHGHVKYRPPPGWLMQSIKSSAELLQGDTLSPVPPLSAGQLETLGSMLPAKEDDMARYPKVLEDDDDGWSKWITPTMRSYKMACCDCGLVHEFKFEALQKIGDNDDGSWQAQPLDTDEYRVQFKARRDARATGQVRRGMRKK